MNYKITKLKNGLKVITSEMPHALGVSNNVFVGAGSRYETKEENGISHFLEHMTFKGTKKRPTAGDVSGTIDSVGGRLNAGTSDDFTYFWNTVPQKYFSLGLELLADTISNSLLKEEEINREKGVIVEEINRYKDMPSNYVIRLGQGLLWGDTPLGRDTLGTKENIKKFQRKDFLNYLKILYQPQNMVISVVGNIKHQEVVQEAEKNFGKLKSSPIRNWDKYKDKQKQVESLVHYKETDQAHLFLGFKARPRNHPDIPILDAIFSILSGGMSARLFINIRERKGLAYHIRSYEDNFLDTGCFFVHAGLNSQKLEEAIKAILEEFKKLKEEKVGDKELRKAKEYLKGNFLLSMDDCENVAFHFGKSALFDKKIKTLEEEIKEIEKVTPEQIQKLAQKLFVKEKLNLALIGPFKDKKPFDDILNKFKL